MSFPQSLLACVGLVIVILSHFQYDSLVVDSLEYSRDNFDGPYGSDLAGTRNRAI